MLGWTVKCFWKVHYKVHSAVGSDCGDFSGQVVRMPRQAITKTLMCTQNIYSNIITQWSSQFKNTMCRMFRMDYLLCREAQTQIGCKICEVFLQKYKQWDSYPHFLCFLFFCSDPTSAETTSTAHFTRVCELCVGWECISCHLHLSHLWEPLYFHW